MEKSPLQRIVGSFKQIQALAKVPAAIRVPIVRPLHWGLARAFERAGFEWEQRRMGDSSLGFWKLSLQGKVSGKRGAKAPKRLVMVPGFGDSTFSWLPILAQLWPTLRKQEFDELVLVDFPGFKGFQSEERFFPSMDQLRRSVGDLFDSLKPHTLVGHSLGGFLSAHYAESCGRGERPEHRGKSRQPYEGPRKIILVNPSGVFDCDHSKERFRGIFERSVSEGFQTFTQYLFAKEPFWFRWFVQEFDGFHAREDMKQFLSSFRDDHFLDGKLGNIRSDVWLLWGDKDSLCLPEQAPIWIAGLRDRGEGSRAAGMMLRGVGHCPQIESPRITALALKQALEESRSAALVARKAQKYWELIE